VFQTETHVRWCTAVGGEVAANALKVVAFADIE
jgi:hypothetical protein